MIIQSVSLENIRSYEHAEVDFDEGITLLAGDIGAGKSTILLAVEFALFGIRAGDISGEGLLRHGEKNGAVTLAFTVDGQDYAVHRELKRTSRGVRQDTGWLEADGERESLTARELKARVLDILGYPEELVTKRKGFVFRYTVYTPQEEMKQIITERAEQRLDTLRSVFGVDKYRTVADNAGLVAKALRDDIRTLEGAVEDLSELEEALEGLEEQRETVSQAYAEAQEAYEQAKDRLEKAKEEGESLEKAHEKEQERKRAVSKLETELKNAKEHRAQLAEDIDEVDELLSKEVESVSDPSDKLEELRRMKERRAEQRTKARTKLQAIREQEEKLRARVENVEELETCPRCKQPVTDEHKTHIRKDAQEELDGLAERKQKLETLERRVTKALSQLAEKEEALQKTRERREEYERLKKKQADAEKRKERLEKRKERLVEKRSSIRERLEELEDSGFDQEAYDEHKKRLEELRDAHADAKAKRASLKAKKESLDEQLEKHADRVEKKNAQKKRLSQLRKKERWLSDAFTPTVSTIEKHVLAAIHQEFSRLFTQWFDMLVEDEGLFAQLDASFAPIVTQDGYDVDIPHLSGGERNSVALAYRLALNNVVGDLLQTIKTTDVLILDEPTDGFSTEQLDRVRDVLLEIAARQLIVVSHEQKMESFVDRVVRVRKHEGVSTVE